MALSGSSASAQPAPYCLPGREPSFGPELTELSQQLGERMGEPIECPHPDATTGDTLQQTSTGLATIQAMSNTASFTSGDEHWQLTPNGLEYWVVPSMDTPAAPDPSPAPVQAVLADAAARMGVDPSQVQLVRAQHVDWPNSSLGCPTPGAVYLQVITPGWLVTVQVDGQTLEYHTDEGSRVLVCAPAVRGLPRGAP
jgi:hypothetical protein